MRSILRLTEVSCSRVGIEFGADFSNTRWVHYNHSSRLG
uniref:Uncharacterized protein n=1 Tax=Schistosoma curassoni TaxID=6186 RepID=A0A183JG40_9TREM